MANGKMLVPKRAKKAVLKANNEQKKPGRMDWFYTLIVIGLLVAGLVMVFSAGYVNAYYYEDNSFVFIENQARFAVLGLIVMFIVSRIQYRIYKRYAQFIYGVALFLLVLVLFWHTNIDKESNIARWIKVPVFGSMQPSEIAKIAIIILFAALVTEAGPTLMKDFKIGFIRFMVYLLPVLFLLVKEPHLSATILVAGVAYVMLAVGGTRYTYLFLSALIMMVGVAFIVQTGIIPYAASRVAIWKDPFADASDAGFQTVQSLYAIASGGSLGQGIGNSRQKFLYVPEPQNDFIFSIICEELGFVGAICIMLAFLLLTFRGLYIAMRVKDTFGKMLVVGISAQIAIQAFLNIAVVTNTIPNTGISLPFFSYGGSAMVTLLGEIGILLNVSRYQEPLVESDEEGTN